MTEIRRAPWKPAGTEALLPSGTRWLPNLALTLRSHPSMKDAATFRSDSQFSWGRFVLDRIGTGCLAWTSSGICALNFESQKESLPPASFQTRWPRVTWHSDDRTAQSWVVALFSPERAEQPINAWVTATPFQARVWEVLLRIPPGHVLSYAAVASACKKPGASRAVGTACGANPIAILIPCHRVVQSTGAIGGYRWGPTLKQLLLLQESRIL